MKDFLLLLFTFLQSIIIERQDLALENLAFRQQLAILKRTQKRPSIDNKDRLPINFLRIDQDVQRQLHFPEDS